MIEFSNNASRGLKVIMAVTSGLPLTLGLYYSNYICYSLKKLYILSTAILALIFILSKVVDWFMCKKLYSYTSLADIVFCVLIIFNAPIIILYLFFISISHEYKITENIKNSL